ncbi:two-component response regulator ORR25-like [Panicum virgatum]|uniref:two-component response regulator ORR25-like n=1 Tax=Panicum virgatum TaxID=38727 RepID=UPI0019D5FFDE|nr:two-component response regulator ORR25-like [Panicum virgatum]
MDANKFPAGLRVLAVDDDRTGLLILKRQLQLCNYNCMTTVTEAETALEMLRERKNRDDQFDVVISDVFMPGIDGFKLLELIGLEMDIPVIMLSANDEMETIMKGIMHGACDYLVKPASIEQLRNIWTHVVKKNRSDPRNNISDGNTRNHFKKNKKDGGCAEEDIVGTSTQKRQRIKWSGQLHRKFVEAINNIGIDRAVPKKILELMNVDGLSRHNVASHLQELVQVGNGVNLHKDVMPVPLPVPVQDVGRFIYSGRHYATGSSDNLSSSSQCFPSGPSSSSSTNISNGVVFSTSMPFPSGTFGSSFASISNEYSPSATTMCFPSSRSCSSYASILRGKILEANRGISFDANSFFEEIANGDMPASSSQLPSQHAELANQPSAHIQSSSAGQFNQVAPSSHLPLHSPEFANQTLIQIQTSSVGLSNQVDRESHQFSGLYNPTNSSRVSVPTMFPDIGHSARMPISSSHGNHVRINQLPTSVASSECVPTFESQYQNQMSGLLRRTTPTLGFSEQVAPFNLGSSAMPIGSSALGSSSSVGPALANLQIGNSVTPTQMPRGGAAIGNLPGGGTVDQQSVGDQVNNSNVLPKRTSEVQDGEIDDVSFNLVELSLAGAEGVPAQPNLACIIDYSDLGG